MEDNSPVPSTRQNPATGKDVERSASSELNDTELDEISAGNSTVPTSQPERQAIFSRYLINKLIDKSTPL